MKTISKGGLSIKDIARKSKVSAATVSRVINSSPLVKKATRLKVLSLVRKYNYHPNLHARSLVKRKSNLLCVAIPPDPNFYSAFYFSQILHGICSALSKTQYRLMIYQMDSPPSDFEGTSEHERAGSLQSFPVEGLLMIAPLVEDQMVKSMEKEDRACVLINGRSKVLDWVDLDNVQSSMRLMEKLVNLGHKRIGFIGGILRNQNAMDRLSGYRTGLEKFKIPFEPDLVVAGNYTVESGYHCAKKLLGIRNPPTAIFTANDLMAIGALQAILDSGMAVPDDISLFGFDDTDLACLVQPALSTVRQPFYEMGKTAAEALVIRTENPDSPQKCVEFAGEVILRQSCAKPSR